MSAQMQPRAAPSARRREANTDKCPFWCGVRTSGSSLGVGAFRPGWDANNLVSSKVGCPRRDEVHASAAVAPTPEAIRCNARATPQSLASPDYDPPMQRTLFLPWGLSITLGALWIRFGVPQAHSDWLKSCADSEVFHILAHTAGYGACTALAMLRFRPLGAVAATLALALVQELAQVVGVRAFSSPELFDLGVDALAAGLVALGAVVALRKPGSLAKSDAREPSPS